MILIADSGSTKTSWCVTGNNSLTEFFQTGGMNPFFRTTAEIADEFREKVFSKIEVEVQEIYFYGAGVINEEKGNIVKNALLQFFPKAKIEVQSDLLAAARATLRRESGIACILGTGSNSCLYNGSEITEHVPPLGFILGDEGSGSVIGRKILGDFLKGILPKNIAEKFRIRFPLNYADFMEGVYKKEKPNKFLAQFIPFIHENIENIYCTQLIENSFEEFIRRNIFSYSGFSEQPVCFVGSVAFYFQEQLKNVLTKNQLQIKTVLQEPMNGLIQYHTEK